MSNKLKVLLRDFGYEYRDGLVIQKGIKGFTSDTIIRRARDIFDAAEQLCPIINEKEFTERLVK